MRQIPAIIRQQDAPQDAPLNTYYLVFEGRELGAIGVFSWFTVEVSAVSLPAARLALYGHFDSVHKLRCTSAWLDGSQFTPPLAEVSEVTPFALYVEADRIARTLRTELGSSAAEYARQVAKNATDEYMARVYTDAADILSDRK